MECGYERLLFDKIKQLPKKLVCPVNGIAYAAVVRQAIIRHIWTQWSWTGSTQAYYFCGDTACHAAYVGEDNSIIPADVSRQMIGIKDGS
jgi:hypothetical protein